MFRLYDYQIDAINRLQNGSILCGGVGSGKSLTAIGYYYLQQGGSIAYLTGEKVVKMKKPKDFISLQLQENEMTSNGKVNCIIS